MRQRALLLAVVTGLLLATLLACRQATAQDSPPLMQNWSPDRYEVFCGEHKEPEGGVLFDEAWGEADEPGDPNCLDAGRRGFLESTGQWFTQRYRSAQFRSPRRFGLAIDPDEDEARMRVYVKNEGANAGIARASMTCDPMSVWVMSANSAKLGGYPKNVLAYIMGHELVHMIQWGYPGWMSPRPDETPPCGPPPDWVAEGIADAISVGATRRLFPAFYPPSPDQVAGESWAGLRPWYRSLHDDLIEKKLKYRTSAFWRHLAESYHRKRYVFLQNYMLSQPPSLGGDAKDWLAWLDQNLRNDDRIGVPLYLVFPSFITEFASQWTEGEAGEKFGRRRWLTDAFGGCSDIKLTPDAPYQSTKVTLRPLAARCLRVTVTGVGINELVSVKIGAMTATEAEADELHLGLAFTNDATGYTCSTHGYPVRDKDSLGCLMHPETGTFKAGTEDRGAARIWPPTPQEKGTSTGQGQTQVARRYSPGLQNVYVISRVPPKPSGGDENTYPYQDKEYEIGVGLDTTSLETNNQSVNKGGEDGKRRSKRRRAVGSLGIGGTEVSPAEFPAAGYKFTGRWGAGMPQQFSDMLGLTRDLAANLRMTIPGAFLLADAEITPRSHIGMPESVDPKILYMVTTQEPLKLGMVGTFQGSVMTQTGTMPGGEFHALKAKTMAEIEVTMNSEEAFVATVTATMCKYILTAIDPNKCPGEYELKARIVEPFAGMYYPDGIFTAERTPGQALYESIALGTPMMSADEGQSGSDEAVGGGDDGEPTSASTGDGGGAAVVDQEPAPVTLEAVETKGGEALLDPGLRWTVVALDSGATLLAEAPLARPILMLTPGRYTARASLDGRTGELTFQVAPGQGAVKQVVLPAGPGKGSSSPEQGASPAGSTSASDDVEQYRALLEAQGLPAAVRDMMLEDFSGQSPETRAFLLEQLSASGQSQ